MNTKMKAVYYWKWSKLILLTLLLSSCNYFPDGTSDIVVDAYEIYNYNVSSSEQVKRHKFHYLILNESASGHLVVEADATDNAEKAFIRTVTRLASKVSEDSLLYLNVDFDNYRILSYNSFHKSELDDVIIDYRYKSKLDSKKTKEQLELEAARNKNTFWKLVKYLAAFGIGVLLFILIPKIFRFIAIIIRRDKIKYELDRLRKIDEQEVRSRIIADLKSKGYDEKTIKEVYDQFTKEHK